MSHSVYGRDRPDVEGNGGDAGGSRSVTGDAGWARERHVATRVAKADAAALAARGYVGVALDFPCTNAPGFSTTDPTVALDLYHQPGDVSFVLTNLLSLSASSGDPLSGLLDPARVGLVGTSSGAITGLLFFNTCCTDSRIRAIEVIKGFPPPTTTGFPLTGVYDWSRPIAAYFWSGCLDIVTPYDLASSAYAQLDPPKAFVTDPTGSHDTPPTFPDGTADAFLDRFVAGDTSPATAAPFLAVDNDPYFAYDLVDAIAPTPPPRAARYPKPHPWKRPCQTQPQSCSRRVHRLNTARALRPDRPNQYGRFVRAVRRPPPRRVVGFVLNPSSRKSVAGRVPRRARLLRSSQKAAATRRVCAANEKEESMESVQQTHQRPGTITLVVVLAWIAGILNIAAGIFVIIDRHDTRIRLDSASTPNELLAAGIAAIVIGAIYCLLASFLGRGSRTARPFSALSPCSISLPVPTLRSWYSGEQRASGVGSLVFSIIVLWLLYGTEKDRDFFAA